jgi:hypothetical protein
MSILNLIIIIILTLTGVLAGALFVFGNSADTQFERRRIIYMLVALFGLSSIVVIALILIRQSPISNDTFSCTDPGDIELLSKPWSLEGGPSQPAAAPEPVYIPENIFSGKDVLQITIDLNGASFQVGPRKDESAIIIDQPEGTWKVASVVPHGIKNGADGIQTIYIPLSDFRGIDNEGFPDGTYLDLDRLYGPLHARFWNDKTNYVVEISSIVACNKLSGE